MIYAVSRDSVLSSLSLILLAYLCVRVCWRGGGMCCCVAVVCEQCNIRSTELFVFEALCTHFC